MLTKVMRLRIKVSYISFSVVLAIHAFNITLVILKLAEVFITDAVYKQLGR